MSTVLAIDPGNQESAYVLMDKETYKPIEFGKIPNEEMLDKIKTLDYDNLAIEMIASYGMPVGREVFDTCVFIGRCVEAGTTKKAKELQKELRGFDTINLVGAEKPFYEYIYRKEEKINLCGSMKAKDSNIRQALIDRFAKFDFKSGKGVKSNQDFFYGFSSDVWAAYAVGVTYLDKQNGD